MGGLSESAIIGIIFTVICSLAAAAACCWILYKKDERRVIVARSSTVEGAQSADVDGMETVDLNDVDVEKAAGAVELTEKEVGEKYELGTGIKTWVGKFYGEGAVREV